jgi:hypothetical protein
MAAAHNTHWKIQILKFQLGKPEGTRPFGKIQYVWEDNIKSNVQQVV